jgi:hypothetical protein
MKIPKGYRFVTAAVAYDGPWLSTATSARSGRLAHAEFGRAAPSQGMDDGGDVLALSTDHGHNANDTES